MNLASLNSSADVTVSRLNLDAPQSARAIALASLDRTSWLAASQAGTRWIILRQVRVSSQSWDLGPRAEAAVQAIANDAVSGWSARAADAMAVSFETLADLVACLSRDLALGQAQRLWYWRHWRSAESLPTLPQLWLDHIPQLPQIALILESQQQLVLPLQTLSIDEVKALVNRMSAVTGWALPTVLTHDELILALRDIRSPSDKPIIKPIASYVASTVGSHPDTTAAVAQLLVMLRLWEEKPQLLLNQQRASITVRTAAYDAMDVSDTKSSISEPLTAQQNKPSSTRQAQDPDHPIEKQKIVDEYGLVNPIDTTDGSSVAPEAEQDFSATNQSLITETEELTLSLPDKEHAAASHISEGIITEFGGVFFLVNALSESGVSEKMYALSDDSGWCWLWHVARALGLEPDASLVQFFMARLECEVPAMLFELPKPAGLNTINQMLERRYHRTGVWDTALLACPAVVRLTASHLDVHIPLAGARVDVRQSGLDRNPGWVDWLGRVVTFHFGEVSELAGHVVDE